MAEVLRPVVGKRIFGCDVWQVVCAGTRCGKTSEEAAVMPRDGIDDVTRVELFSWTEEEFLERTEGSAIRRAGYTGWLRNIAVALGNVDLDEAQNPKAVIDALEQRLDHSSDLVKEHVIWALDHLKIKEVGF